MPNYNDYDDDDLIDYEEDYYSEDEPMTEQDEEALHISIAEVKSLLDGRKISDDEIKESVLYYNFDSQRAAKYLSDKFDKANRPKPVAKPVAKPMQQPALKNVKPVEVAFTKPSPDDVVQAAQEKGGFLEKGVSNLSIADKKENVPVKVVRKIDINQAKQSEEDQRPTISFVVIGHVDAGKSTLMGRLLYDTGAVDQGTINKYKRESEREGKGSFHLAWVMDQTLEERQRGVTMDICTSQFETSAAKFTIVDAPGHRDFVPNMIAGTSQADVAVLVVDSSTNAFEAGFMLDGQTKEHAILVRSLGVERMIVAVNKLDTNDWSQERFEEIKIQLTEFLSKVVGFKASALSFVPTSGLQGVNIAKPVTEKGLSWYHGLTLLQTLEHKSSSQRDFRSNLRMLIADASLLGHNQELCVSGRIDSGSVQVGERILIEPSEEYALVKSISSNGSKSWAVAGDNVTLALNGIDSDKVRAGYVVCNPEAPVSNNRKFVSRIVIFDLKRPLLTGTKLVLHRGRTNEQCKISKILSTIDKSTGNILKSKPRHLIGGQTANIEITLENSIPLETFKSCKELGRIVLRKDGVTVAAGVVDELL